MTTPNDNAERSAASAGSQLREQIAALVYDAMRFDREAKTPKWQGGNSYAESRARQAAWQIATLFQPALTDEERHAIAIVRNCAMTRAERFLTQSDAEMEATLVLWRLRERLG